MAIFYYRQSTTPTIVTDGLVLNLDAKNPASYPGTGTTWTNLANAGVNGAINGATYENSEYFSFNGSSNFVNVPDQTGVTDFDRTNNYSVFFLCYVHPTQSWTTTQDVAIVEKWGSPSGPTGPYPYVFRWYRNYNLMIVGIYDGTTAIDGGISVTAGNWIYCGATFDWTGEAKCKMYLNGAYVDSFNLTLTNSIMNSSPLGIMRRENGTNYARGSMSAIQIYNKTLSAAEVSQNFEALRGRFGL